MAVAANLRKGIARFLILSAALHLVISVCVFVVEHRRKAQVAKVDQQTPVTSTRPWCYTQAGPKPRARIHPTAAGNIPSRQSRQPTSP